MILLDTHTWLWLCIQPKKLSRPATRAIERAARTGALAVASITLLEAAWLFANGRIRRAGAIGDAVREVLEASRATVLEITPEVAAISVQLPDSVPPDPADRLIVATAIVHGISLVTRDARLQDSGVCQTVW